MTTKLFGHSFVRSRESDEDLMTQVARDDTKAFKELYERYRAPMLSYCYNLIRNQAPAEDCAQEIFLRVYRSRASYTASAKFSTWLWTIAHNVCMDHFRKKGELPLDPEMEIQGRASDAPYADDDGAFLDEKIQEAHLQHCLQQLTVTQRDAVMLRTFSDLSYEEIASTLKATLAGVKSVLHRAKAQLTECLKRRITRE